MSVYVEFPEELLIASREEPDSFARKVMIYTLGHLYEQGKISSGTGAHVLGCDRRDFYCLLSEYGFSVIDHPDDELQCEARSSRQIADKVSVR